MLSILFSSALALYDYGSNVRKVTAKDFSSLTAGIVLLQFYSPNCGHCHQLAPQYEKAAKALKGVFTVAAIDATVESTPESIRGYPTIKFYLNGKSEEYQGQRTAEAIVRFVMDKLSKLVNNRLYGKEKAKAKSSAGSSRSSQNSQDNVIVLTESNFQQQVLNSKDAWFVQFYAPWCGHCKNLAPEWEKLASQLKGEVKVAKVDATVEKSLAGQYGVSGFPTLIWFPAGSNKDNHQTYQGARQADSMRDWALKQVGQVKIKQIVDKESLLNACEDKHLCVLAFLPHKLDTTPQQQKRQIDFIQAVARDYTNIKFVWTTAGAQPSLQNYLDLQDFPAVVCLAPLKKLTAKMLKALTGQNLKEFVQSIMGGKYKQWRSMKSGGWPSIEKVSAAEGQCSGQSETCSQQL